MQDDALSLLFSTLRGKVSRCCLSKVAPSKKPLVSRTVELSLALLHLLSSSTHKLPPCHVVGSFTLTHYQYHSSTRELNVIVVSTVYHCCYSEIRPFHRNHTIPASLETVLIKTYRAQDGVDEIPPGCHHRSRYLTAASVS